MLKDLDCGQYSLLRPSYESIPRNISVEYSAPRTSKGTRFILNVYANNLLTVAHRNNIHLVPSTPNTWNWLHGIPLWKSSAEDEEAFQVFVVESLWFLNRFNCVNLQKWKGNNPGVHCISSEDQ